METQITQNSFNFSIRQRKIRRPTKHSYLLLSSTPLVLIVAGSVLTVVGNIAAASFTSCKIAGPVLITAGGLLLLFITIWNSCQRQLTENTNCVEEAENSRRQSFHQVVLGNGSIDPLEPIHHFEIRIPSESYDKEMVPPSYEEAVNN